MLMYMKIAVIDLGTNTFNLLIVNVNADHSYSTIFQTKISVKLAEGGINKGFIAPVPFQRGQDAFKTHFETTQQYKADKILHLLHQQLEALRMAMNLFKK